MNPERLLRWLAILVFAVGLFMVWSDDLVDWRWLFTCLYDGIGLFVGSFLVRPPIRRT